MKCNKCGTTIKKLSMTGLNIFLPKVVDKIQCSKCGTCYGVSSLTDWGYFLFYNGGFVILFFIFFGYIQQFVDSFYGISFLSFICLLLFDYLVALLVPLKIIKCDAKDN
jgi:hypothetical protein